MRRRDFCLGLAATPVLAGAARAQGAYPSRPVRLIIPFPPGGSNDIVGRMIAQQLSERLGQQVFPDNRGGAGGTIGTGNAAHSAPDGHTLLLISVAYVFNTALYKQLPYDPLKSFVPIAMLGSGPVAVTVHPGVPARTVAELIKLAKDKPGQLTYATAGVGSLQHLASELFRISADIDAVHVPYKGGGPATADVVAGHAQISIGSLIQQLPHIKSGGLRVLATTGKTRSPALPDVPTVAETLPGFEAANWWGLVAPAGTPQPILDRLYKEVTEIVSSPETRKRFETEGAEPLTVSPAEFGRLIETETEKWAAVVRKADIKGE